jgi:hypothetical protein
MQVSSTVKNRQTIAGYLTTLYLYHEQSAEQYRELADMMVDRKEILSLTNSLMDYHQDRSSKIRSLIEDLGPSPVKPNADMFSDVKELSIQHTENDLSLLQHYKAQEERILKYYISMLDNDGIPQGLYEKLQQMSERTQEVSSKLHRIISTGMERDMSV